MLIPGPSLLNLKSYEPNVSAMTEHYTGLFEGRTHRDVVGMLDDGGISYYYSEPDRLNFAVSKFITPLAGSYSIGMDVLFEDSVSAGCTTSDPKV